MNMNMNIQMSTKTYLEDTVCLTDNSAKLGVVTRTWHDVEDDSAVENDGPDDGSFVPLPQGHVQVSFLDNSPPKVVDENKLVVLDRSLHIGDVVKRRPEDMMSGIVSNARMNMFLQHTFTGQTIQNVDSRHVKFAVDYAENQYILYDLKWIGVIDDLVQKVIIRLQNNTLVEVQDADELRPAASDGSPIVTDSLFLSGRFIVGHHVIADQNSLLQGRWLLGEYDPEIPPNGVVVDVRTKTISVNWLAHRNYGNWFDFTIEPSEVQDPDHDPVVLLSSLSDATSHQIGDGVRFLDREVETGVYGGQRMERMELNGFDGNVWTVLGTETIVDVEWQDGTTSTDVQAKDLRMYLNVDEYEAWPGDFVSKEQPDGPRFGIIQSAIPEQRVARVRFFDDGELSPQVEEISLYDLTSHPILQYSLSDKILIRSKIVPPPSGLVEGVVSLATEFVEGLVRTVTEMHDEDVHSHRRTQSTLIENIDWMGEIVKIHTNGTVIVRLARELDPPPGFGGERYEIVKAENLIVLDTDEDNQEEEVDVIADDEDWEDEEYTTDDEWEDTSDGSEEIGEASLDGITDVESNFEQIDNKAMAAPGVALGLEEGRPSDESIDEIPPVSPSQLQFHADSEKCPRFDMLEEVPDDHPFKSDVPINTPATWLARIRKEHNILQSSLPGILVRTYESRLDLLRVLIIGPNNTPYENAPFLFDFSLGNEFPTEPPEAFFHSWTPGGSGGRVNPNLYVEGRVCLSLLGTWHSQNDTESWNPKQSTLLQLFLSIQSLVLTARPYYNEAGFGVQVDLDDASVNERLYSERAYFLSRGFVKWALENPIEGLENEVRHLYTDEDGPQLAKVVIEDGNRVIANSESEGEDDGEWQRGRVTRVSRGGLEVLRRTISALERLTGSVLLV